MDRFAFPLRGPRFVWQAAGCPAPVETDGAPIRPRKLPEGTRCASCGEPASYRLDDAISDSFTTVKNASRAWPFGGGHLCAGCVWACKTLALRCCLWFARLPDERGRGGVWFVPMRPIAGWPATRPDPLSALLADVSGASGTRKRASGTAPGGSAGQLDPLAAWRRRQEIVKWRTWTPFPR